MRKVASLFETQADASAAIDALGRTDLDGVEIEVYEQSAPVPDAGVRAFGIPPNDSHMHGSAIGFFGENVFDGIDDDLANFLRQAVQNGEAVLVIAEVDDDRAAEMEQFFHEHGGRTSVED